MSEQNSVLEGFHSCDRVNQMATRNHLTIGKVTVVPTRYFTKRSLQISRRWLVVIVILLLPYDDFQRTNFLQVSRSFSQKTQFLSEVDRFEHRYRSDQAIQWYANSSGLSAMIDTICRTQNPLLISKIRYVLHDIHEQLAQVYVMNRDQMPKSIVVYYAQRFSLTDFRRLSRSRGKTVFTTTLLLANVSRDLTDLLPTSNNSLDGPSRNEITVVFNIKIRTQTAGFRPFACIPRCSDSESQRKFLLSIGTVFTCVDICEKVSAFRSIAIEWKKCRFIGELL